jgi:hypothetical protein
MIKQITRAVFRSYYNSVEKFIDHPHATQEKILNYLLEHGRNTRYGSEHQFDEIHSVSDFQRRVPVTTYEDLRPYLNKIIREKERNVLWDSPVKWFAMSSGTTEDKSKYIPVTRESLQHCHYRCGYHMLGLYANSYPDTEFFLGKTLVLGGSKQVNSIGNSTFTGDISAILMKNLPAIVKLARTPERIALLPDWEEKLKRLSEYAKGADIRALLGVPSWMLVLLKKISEETGKELPELWKNLEVFFHGGVSFTPFRQQYERLIPSARMRYWETYNASEGFFGVQFSDRSNEMLLLLDNEVYYEFLPVGEWDKVSPQTVTLSEVEVGKQYALVISTSGGLWRYKIGDTIEFTSTNPYLFRITGRTRQYINAFGEELIVDNADRAMAEACRITRAKVTEYTAAPIYFDDQHGGAHEWLIEFEESPADMDQFKMVLDEQLKKLNSDYEAKRSYNLSLGMPVIRVLEQGCFYKWMKYREKVGGQNKVPKLSNDRKYVDSILEALDLKS